MAASAIALVKVAGSFAMTTIHTHMTQFSAPLHHSML